MKECSYCLYRSLQFDCTDPSSTPSEKQEDLKERGDVVNLDISVGDTGAKTFSKEKSSYHLPQTRNVFRLQFRSNVQLAELQNFPIWCCSRLKNISAEECELESFAIRS